MSGWPLVLVVLVALVVVGLFVFYKFSTGLANYVAVDSITSVLNEIRGVLEKKRQLVVEVNGLSDQDRGDFDRFLPYVKEAGCGSLLQYASEELRSNRELVLEAIKHPDLEIDGLDEPEYATLMECLDSDMTTKEILNDSRFGSLGIYGTGPTNSPLKFASKELQDDKDVVWKAITHAPHAYQYASEKLRGDPTLFALAYLEFETRKSIVMYAGIYHADTGYSEEGGFGELDVELIPEDIYYDSVKLNQFQEQVKTESHKGEYDYMADPDGVDEYWNANFIWWIRDLNEEQD